MWRIPRVVLEDLDDQKSINYVLNQLPDPVSFEEKIKELYANKDQISFDILKLKDGRTVEGYSQPQLVNDRYVGRVWSFRDITKQLADEDNIRKSEETRSLIMKAAMDAIICIDLSGNIIFWNQQAEEIFGWKSDEVMNKQFADFIIPDHYQKSHHEGMAHFKKTGEGAILNKLTELSAIRRNGDEFPIELTVTEIMQDNEQFFCAFIRDITQRKKAEIALQKSNERFNLAAKATSDIIWDWNLITGKVIRSEENMVKLLGYAKQVTQDPRFNWMDLIHADDIARINEKFDKCLNDPTIFYMDDEYRFQKASGEYAYLYDKGYIIRDGNGKATRMIGSTQDITRIKENELQLKKRADELAISNLELEQFAFITSHDLQEPLRMITGFLTQLDRKYNHLLDDKARKYIFYAVDGARRMRQIILDLLEYSRVGRGDDKMEDIDLNELMHEIQILLQKKIIQKNAEVHIADLPVIKSYRGPLRQVFQNLISNALKYNRENVNSNISIAVNEVNNEWQFSITDNGIGIEEEYFEKIFVLFQRLHDKTEYSGTGVGLPVTKKIVESLGGKIWVASKPDEGSTFYFTIPQKSF